MFLVDDQMRREGAHTYVQWMREPCNGKKFMTELSKVQTALLMVGND